MTTALGTQSEDSDELFVEHTYLVNTAEIIAQALVGFDLQSIAPASLLSGGKFEESAGVMTSCKPVEISLRRRSPVRPGIGTRDRRGSTRSPQPMIGRPVPGEAVRSSSRHPGAPAARGRSG